MSSAPLRHTDRLGAFASGLCALHCALSATLPSLLAALGLGALLDHEAEHAFIGAALLLAGLSVVLGWKRRSQSNNAILLGGMALLLASAFVEENLSELGGTALSIVAGITLITGHLRSLKGASES